MQSNDAISRFDDSNANFKRFNAPISPEKRFKTLRKLGRACGAFHCDQDGGTIFSLLIAVLGLAVMVGFVTNMASETVEKERAQHAADSLAYASGLWLARGMNAAATLTHDMGDKVAYAAMINAVAGPEKSVKPFKEDREMNQRIDRSGNVSLAKYSPNPLMPAEVLQVSNMLDGFRRQLYPAGLNVKSSGAAVYDAETSLKYWALDALNNKAIATWMMKTMDYNLHELGLSATFYPLGVLIHETENLPLGFGVASFSGGSVQSELNELIELEKKLNGGSTDSQKVRDRIYKELEKEQKQLNAIVGGDKQRKEERVLAKKIKESTDAISLAYHTDSVTGFSDYTVAPLDSLVPGAEELKTGIVFSGPAVEFTDLDDLPSYTFSDAVDFFKDNLDWIDLQTLIAGKVDLLLIDYAVKFITKGFPNFQYDRVSNWLESNQPLDVLDLCNQECLEKYLEYNKAINEISEEAELLKTLQEDINRRLANKAQYLAKELGKILLKGGIYAIKVYVLRKISLIVATTAAPNWVAYKGLAGALFLQKTARQKNSKYQKYLTDDKILKLCEAIVETISNGAISVPENLRAFGWDQLSKIKEVGEFLDKFEADYAKEKLPYEDTLRPFAEWFQNSDLLNNDSVDAMLRSIVENDAAAYDELKRDLADLCSNIVIDLVFSIPILDLSKTIIWDVPRELQRFFQWFVGQITSPEVRQIGKDEYDVYSRWLALTDRVNSLQKPICATPECDDPLADRERHKPLLPVLAEDSVIRDNGINYRSNVSSQKWASGNQSPRYNKLPKLPYNSKTNNYYDNSVEKIQNTMNEITHNDAWVDAMFKASYYYYLTREMSAVRPSRRRRWRRKKNHTKEIWDAIKALRTSVPDSWKPVPEDNPGGFSIYGYKNNPSVWSYPINEFDYDKEKTSQMVRASYPTICRLRSGLIREYRDKLRISNFATYLTAWSYRYSLSESYYLRTGDWRPYRNKTGPHYLYVIAGTDEENKGDEPFWENPDVLDQMFSVCAIVQTQPRAPVAGPRVFKRLGQTDGVIAAAQATFYPSNGRNVDKKGRFVDADPSSQPNIAWDTLQWANQSTSTKPQLEKWPIVKAPEWNNPKVDPKDWETKPKALDYPTMVNLSPSKSDLLDALPEARIEPSWDAMLSPVTRSRLKAASEGRGCPPNSGQRPNEAIKRAAQNAADHCGVLAN